MMSFEGLSSEKGAFLRNPDDGSLLIGTGGEFRIVTTFGREEREVFYLKDFYSDTFLRYTPDQIFHLTSADAEQFFASEKIPRPLFQSMGTEDHIYRDDFRDLMKSFSGALRKVVMISRENFVTGDPTGALNHLACRAVHFGAGIPYGIWGSDFGIVGSTPEELFNLKDGLLSTHALAGTTQKGNEQELMSSPKDLLEHNLVVRDITEKLDSFSGTISVGETYTAGFKDIVHLKTDITAAVSDDVNISALVSALSPTAALGGYPKKESLRFLRETRYFKKYPGRNFGSTMGVVTKDEARFIVMIRNVQWKDQTYFIESGGGVVPGSELDKELSEITWKRNLVKEHYL